jgi:hypothetical protein
MTMMIYMTTVRLVHCCFQIPRRADTIRASHRTAKLVRLNHECKHPAPSDDNDETAARYSKLTKIVPVSPQKKTKAIKRALDTSHSAPARWRETHDAIREMRVPIHAPVEMMG